MVKKKILTQLHRWLIMMCINIEIRFVLPVVTRFLCPPEIPLNIAFPTTVSAHISNPKTWNVQQNKQKTLKNDTKMYLLWWLEMVLKV
jgi:hypothetical protein